MKRRIALVSGWLGRGEGGEYSVNRDGTSDYILGIIERLNSKAVLIPDLEEIRSTRSSFDGELHLNVQVPLTPAPKFCCLLETPEIRPQNLFYKMVTYERIYTFNRSLAGSQGCVWTPYPHSFKGTRPDGCGDRNILFSMIASNRNTLFNGNKSLYTERQNAIKFFSEDHPGEMQLFGAGWDNQFVRPGVLPRVRHEIGKRLLSPKKAAAGNVWYGLAESKHPILKRTKFNFCYENMIGIPGYVSEKIYDSAANGAIPIYIPSSDENEDLVPRDLYIDPREFESYKSLRSYCLSITAADFAAWQQRLCDFCNDRGPSLHPETRADWLTADLLNSL